MNYALRNKHCKKLLLLAVFLVASATGFAGVNESEPLTASKVFAEIPIDVLDMIRPSTRLDMLDYYAQADSILEVQDALGGKSRLQEVTPDYLKVAVTPVSTLEIKLLNAGKTPIVMTLYTVSSNSSDYSDNSDSSNSSDYSNNSVSDTEVRFFDASLKPLDASKYFRAPALKDFFNLKGSGISEKELTEKIPFTAVVYSIASGEAPLSATLTSLNSLSQEDQTLLKPLLRAPLQSPWKSKFTFK